MVFSKARANKRQQKTDLNRHSLGNEQELNIAKPRVKEDSVKVR